MTQKLFDIGKGALLGGRVSILVGSGTPGLGDDTLNARPGSLYLDDLDGGSYRKVRTAAGTDKWELIGVGLSPKVVSGVQGLAVVDQSYATESAVVKWLVDVTRTNDPASRYLTEITALHDGSTNTDATRVDWNDYGVLHFGPAIDGLAIGVRLNGSGSAQVVELTVAAEVAVDVVVRRADLGLYLGAAEPLDISAAPHAATHTAGGTDPLAIDAAQVVSGAFDIARVPVAGSVSWDGVTGTPTTLAGYGVSDAPAARATLGLGDAATRNVGTTAGSIAAGDHTHAGVYEPANANVQAHIGAGGSAHPVATTMTAGFMGPADKAKLAAIAAGANAYIHPNHSGEVISAGDGATTIAPNAVTMAKMQQVGSATVLGRASAGTGNVEVLAPSAARSVLGLGDAATRNVGTTAGTVAAGDDARLGNARTPLSHAAAHASGGSDPLALDASQVTSGTFDVARVPLAGSVAWSGVSGKPTTLAGYGISDAQPYNANIQAHIASTTNPHGTSAEQVGAAPASHVGSGGDTHATATAATAGFMSPADKQKLDGIAAGAIAYMHPTGDGNLHVPATGTGSAGQVLKAGVTAGAMGWSTLGAADVGAAAEQHTHSWKIVTAAYTAAPGERVLANTSAGPFTVNLPAAPAVGDYVEFANGADYSINNLTIGRNGSMINGVADDLVIDMASMSVGMVYGGNDWRMY